jgi:phosphoglycerate dehydrogenase-like enzyme
LRSALTVQTARTEGWQIMANKIGILGSGNVGSPLARGPAGVVATATSSAT